MRVVEKERDNLMIRLTQQRAESDRELSTLRTALSAANEQLQQLQQQQATQTTLVAEQQAHVVERLRDELRALAAQRDELQRQVESQRAAFDNERDESLVRIDELSAKLDVAARTHSEFYEREQSLRQVRSVCVF